MIVDRYGTPLAPLLDAIPPIRAYGADPAASPGDLAWLHHFKRLRIRYERRSDLPPTSEGANVRCNEMNLIFIGSIDFGRSGRLKKLPSAGVFSLFFWRPSCLSAFGGRRGWVDLRVGEGRVRSPFEEFKTAGGIRLVVAG
jgi:hypothetical protein